MSDWNAGHNVSDIKNGLDTRMGWNGSTEPITEYSLREISMEYIDRAVLRILKAMIRTGIMDDVNDHSMDRNVRTDEHLFDA